MQKRPIQGLDISLIVCHTSQNEEYSLQGKCMNESGSMRKNIMGFFMVNPDIEISAVALAARTNTPAQQLTHHLERLAGEEQLELIRQGKDIIFRLPPKKAKEAKRALPQYNKVQPVAIQVLPKEGPDEVVEPVAAAPIVTAEVESESATKEKSRPPAGPKGKMQAGILALFEAVPDKALSIPQVADAAGISTQVTSQHFKKLLAAGKLRKLAEVGPKNCALYKLPVRQEVLDRAAHARQVKAQKLAEAKAAKAAMPVPPTEPKKRAAKRMTAAHIAEPPAPAPRLKPTLEKTMVLFLKSIRERIAANQPLNEYENAMLLQFLDSLVTQAQ